MTLPTGAAKVTIRREVWDDWKDASTMWAIKEQIDNGFNKAERALPAEAVPWNAHNIELNLTTLDDEGVRPGDVLIISDDGRGLTYDEFTEGFFGMGHTSENKPQEMSGNAISVFGTGSKTADASLSQGVYYFTVHADADYAIIARNGKDLSVVKDDPDLLIADMCIPKSIRELAAAKAQGDLAWTLTRYWNQHLPNDVALLLDKLSSICEARYKSIFDEKDDGQGFARAVNMCEKYLPLGTTGFIRMLLLRPEKTLQVRPGGQGFCYPLPSKDGTTLEMNVVELLEANYLFPPALPQAPAGAAAGGAAGDGQAGGAADTPAGGRQHGGAADGDDQAEQLQQQQQGVADPELVALQQEVVQQLQAPNYYIHPTTGELYSPSVKVQGQKVNWGNNPLLRNVQYKRSPALEIEPNTAYYGNSYGEPPARVMVQYLGDTQEQRFAAKDSGVAVYVGCRRVCDPELTRGNWQMAGVADELMDFATSVTAWSVFHSSHTGSKTGKTRNLRGSGQRGEQEDPDLPQSIPVRDGLRTRDYMGASLYDYAIDKAQQLDKLLSGNNSHFLTLRGVHVVVVVKPGLLRLTDDKRGFLASTPHAKNLMYACLRKAVGWMLANPPRDLEVALQVHREKKAAEAERAALKAAQAQMTQEEKQQERKQRRQDALEAAAAKKRKLSLPSDGGHQHRHHDQAGRPMDGSVDGHEGQHAQRAQDEDGPLHEIKLEDAGNSGGGLGLGSPEGRPARSAGQAGGSTLPRPAGNAAAASAPRSAGPAPGKASGGAAAAPPKAQRGVRTVLANLGRQVKGADDPAQAARMVEELMEWLAPECRNTKLKIKHGAPGWITRKPT